MIDFIEYVVSELKSKKLSKNNALALIKQYSSRATTTGKASVIHPLLHVNTSNLSQQSYSSTFTGKEFFLDDHQVNMDGQQGVKILPGVAYLEMACVAVEQAVPSRSSSAILELQDIVWMQPVVVTDSKEVSIALWATENDQIDFEIYSQDHDSEIIHCRGKANFVGNSAPAKLDVEQLKGKMQRGKLNSASIYAAYSKMGLNYGPTHQLISTIFQGEDQLLAQLRLSSDTDEQSQYLLHPGLMDGALQSTVGLIADINQVPDKPSVPFALEKIRILSACKKNMFVWVRYAQGSKPEDKIIKLDIDLCDLDGNVCVQIGGFSSRTLTSDVSQPKTDTKVISSLLAAPVWQSTTASKANELAYSQHHIILCDLKDISTNQIESKVTQSQCLSLQSDEQKNIAERYSAIALSCFEKVQAILYGKPQGNVLLQVVIANEIEGRIFTGLSGLLKTASLENPQFTGQIIFTDTKTTTDELVVRLQDDKNNPQDRVINYEGSTRYVLRLQEIPSTEDKPVINFKDQGVYLISGGLGGLGILFAKEILKQTKARIVLIGRSALTESKKTILNTLSGSGSLVEYRQVDIANLDQVKQLIADIKNEHKQLNGILHCAGMISDNFILKKTSDEFKQVLAPKVAGTFNLDEASKDTDLDFFVLFSSGVSVTGNYGQSDYATANGFMDHFAGYRNKLAGAKQRYGKTLSINWPLWQEGGMSVDQAVRKNMQEVTGVYPMQTITGTLAFYRSLNLQQDQVLVIEGDLAKVRPALFSVHSVQTENPKAEPGALQAEQTSVKETNSGSLLAKTQEYLRKQFAAVLKLSASKIDIQAPLENYGINSILAMNLTNQLEKTFGTLSKTLFFEYQTIAELSEHFSKTYHDKLSELLEGTQTKVSAVKAIPVSVKSQPDTNIKNLTKRRFSRQPQVVASTSQLSRAIDEPIAIIGISGRYPQSPNIQEFWNNLRDGKDCITEVPKERWDWREFYNVENSKPGNHTSKWGGFISGVDEFDPRFFNISPREAIYIDPQERLFLQHAWMAVEDAGYTRASLQIPHGEDQPGQVGVYVGVMYGEYNLSGSLASIANRVSYVLNLHGPSMTLDTMCSSSLTAIHLACQDLKHGRTNLAIAGGVNVSIHPNKYSMLSFGQFISSDGRCQSFGEGGDGYIPGEGVGAVILKRLSEAERDGNHIYGIIKGSAINHGGKTNGYTVPNPQAQASAIRRAMIESNTNPRHISYIEAHGTGTKLGDPIEIASLSKAFQQHTEETGFCLLGSAKSNIGHCESAAGVAGITKVLLQMKYQQIVPSLHSAQLNPNIDFEKTPFVVNQELKKWEQPVVDGKQIPRLAGLSSFGAGGSNAHIILQEYVSEANLSVSTETTVIIPLSARTVEQLKQKASDLLEFIQTSRPDLEAAAYTLQVGREAMEERLGFIVNSIDQLTDKLKAYLKGEQDIEDVYQGQMKQNNGLLSSIITDADFEDTLNKWLSGKRLSKVLELWVNGFDLNWNRLYSDIKPKRISLPAYPFAKERYWNDPTGGMAAAGGKITTALHPLLHTNTSNFSQLSYSSTFSGKEFFLNDHEINTINGSGQKIFPALAFLEMARVAIEKASSTEQKSVAIELQNIAWGQPAMINEAKQVTISLFENDTDDQSGKLVDYDIYSVENGAETVHCQGQAIFTDQPSPVQFDIEQIINQVAHSRSDATNLYAILNKMGFNYGPGSQCVKAIYKGNGVVLAEISLPSASDDLQKQCVLHPGIMNGALHASIELFETNEMKHPLLPIALESLRVYSACTKEMFVLIRSSAHEQQSEDDLIKLDIDLCDKQGNVCVQISGLSLRQIALGASLQTRKIALPINSFISTAAVTNKPKAIQLHGLVEINSAESNAKAKPQAIQLMNAQKANDEITNISLRKPVSIPLTGAPESAGLITSQPQKIQLNRSQELAGVTITTPGQTNSSANVSVPLFTISKEMEPGLGQAQLQEQLRISLAEALYLKPSEIDIDKAFVDLGLDSIIGVEWIKVINKQLGLEVSATRVYDYSNIRAFASFLYKELENSTGSSREKHSNKLSPTFSE
jgi:polyketide synthase PksL